MKAKISEKRKCFCSYGMIKVNGRWKITKCDADAVFETKDKDAIPFCRLHARRFHAQNPEIPIRELSKFGSLKTP